MFNTTDPVPRSEGEQRRSKKNVTASFRNIGVGIGGLGLGYGGLKVGKAAEDWQKSSPANPVNT